MAKVLFNPTNETFTYFYGGVEYVIPPEPERGSKQKVDDRVANFLVTKLGLRGLMTLEYGDEGDTEEKKRVEGKRVNREFKRRQVISFNQQNEARKHQRLPYNMPSETISAYAKELGLKVLEPYNIDDLEQKAVIEKTKENEELRDMVAKLTQQVQQLLAKSNGMPKEDFLAKQRELGYKLLRTEQFRVWVNENRNVIPGLEIEIQADIQQKWEGLCDDPYPIGAA